MAPHSSTLAWKIPWMEEPGGLQSMRSLRVGHDWASSLTFHFHALEKEMATHSSVLAWRIPGTAEPGGLPSMGSHKSWTRLKRLSISSSSRTIPGYQCSSVNVHLVNFEWRNVVWYIGMEVWLEKIQVRSKECGWDAFCNNSGQG